MATWTKIVWLILFFEAGAIGAQEKSETPSQKTKGAVDKLLRTPAAVAQTLQNLGDTAKAKFRDAVAETKPTKADSETPAPVQQNAGQPPPPSFSTIGRRDPFRPFTLNARTNTRPRENLAPLERYELGQLRLVGVVWHVKEPNAIVEDSTGLGYVVKVGTPIGANDGKVRAIKPDEIIIEETYVDLSGAKKRRDVNMKLSVEKAE
jgi:Tfp pilus assembly protein PilP